MASDKLLAHKAPYLNVPFFMIRIVIFFAAWILLTRYLRKLSLQEDSLGGIEMFEKMEFWSKVFIFRACINFFDGIVRLDHVDW